MDFHHIAVRNAGTLMQAINVLGDQALPFCRINDSSHSTMTVIDGRCVKLSLKYETPTPVFHAHLFLVEELVKHDWLDL